MEVKIKLTIKACCLFEQMTGKSFFKCETQEDVLHILYAMFIDTNDLTITYKTFLSMLENKKMVKALMKDYNDICKYLEQLNLNKKIEDYNHGKKGAEEELTITNIASSLIVQHGLDPSYVMEKMQMWEIMPLFEAAENKRRAELMDKRFWTWLTICPHIDSKKIKSADQLFKFDWEKGGKQKAEKDLMEKEEYIKKFFEAQRKAREEREKAKEAQEDGK